MKTALERGRTVRITGFFVLGICMAALVASGCYLPGLGALGDASDPPANTDPSGLNETYYGKFLIYTVAGGKVQMLKNGTNYDSTPGEIPYIVGDETYFPSNLPVEAAIYNRNHYGNGQVLDPNQLPLAAIFDPSLTFDPTQTFFYRNDVDALRLTGVQASSRPEGIVLNGSLNLYYTNFSFFDLTALNPLFWTEAESGCGDAGGSTPLALNSLTRATFSVPNDVDTYDINITTPGTVVVFRGRWSQLNSGAGFEMQIRHRMKLVLTDDSANVLAVSSHGDDQWMYQDPEISWGFTVAGTYHLLVEDMMATNCNGNEDIYWLFVESPDLTNPVSRIMKGEIQPSRSGNPTLDGGPTFEPDDVSTKVEDYWPDCDGIPGDGDEGDAGIYERCGSASDYGAHDGRTQYQEVDDKTAIDDGEYFKGVPTNVGTAMDSEASLIKTPDRDSLLMFVNYGSRIYMLESLDGKLGLKWDLSNIVNNRPSIVPRPYSSEPGDPNSPVVSSGVLGFCDTVPDVNDAWGSTEMEAFVNLYGDSVTASGAVPNAPTGYPGTYGITFGSNDHLDSPALVDDQVGNTIYSGPDGIVNTFLAPRFVTYSPLPYEVIFKTPGFRILPNIIPGDTQGTEYSGPGNPDDPSIYFLSGATAGYEHPLAAAPYNGSNRSGFLLGDDEWNPAIFTSTDDLAGDTVLTPPAYMDRQHCNFYNLGHSFNQCAYGVPVDENGEEPPAIQTGSDGRLDTLSGLLKAYDGDDHLCHDGDTVGICAGPDGKFGWKDMYIPIKGDDRLEIVRDTAHTDFDFPGLDATAYWYTIHSAYDVQIGSTVYPGISWPERLVVGIGSGPDHVLETQIIDSNTSVDTRRWIVYLGGDRLCETLDGYPAICPGVEVKIDLNSFNSANFSIPPRDPDFVMPMPQQTDKLLSDWTMYFSSPYVMTLFNEGDPLTAVDVDKADRTMRSDDYDVFDDVFCTIGGELAVCSGENGYFQNYPVTRRVKIDEDKDLMTIWRRDATYVGKDCYSLVSEFDQKSWDKEKITYYRLYHDLGVRGDDRVKWDSARGYFITTGRNGISQSCISPQDVRTVHHVGGKAVTIGFNKGLPNMPIISAGLNGRLDTYPLADEKIYWGDNIYKISTGRDGVSNSYAMGDDRLEIFMGTGKPDYPCVRSGDGYPDTYAQKNDTQLYDPADRQKTGFDSFNVWGPDAVAVGSKIYLYYSSLGWEDAVAAVRGGRGAVGDLGECRRPGLDHIWGKKDQNLTLVDLTKDENAYGKYDYEYRLDKAAFRRLLDDNPGVVLAPRIGVATSTISRLRADPGDWDFSNKPALDTGMQCQGSSSPPISIEGIAFPIYPDINWNGAFSPDVHFASNENDDGNIFLMFFSGRYALDSNDPGYEADKNQIGIARSLDGINWEVLRKLDPLMLNNTLDYFALLGLGQVDPQYAYPAVVDAGKDQYGEPMYGMFFQTYFTKVNKNANADYTTLLINDYHNYDHIGYAIRKGKSNFGFCSLRANYWSDDSQRVRGVLQMVVLAIPLLLVFSVRIYRKSKS